MWPVWRLEKRVGKNVGGDSACGPVAGSAAEENCPLLRIGFAVFVGERI